MEETWLTHTALGLGLKVQKSGSTEGNLTTQIKRGGGSLASVGTLGDPLCRTGLVLSLGDPPCSQLLDRAFLFLSLATFSAKGGPEPHKGH